jgi:hypothetical protein
MTVNEISDIQKEQLLKVMPSKDWTMEYRPCQVTLKNGDTLDNVYVQEQQSYLKTWGVMPDVDSGKRYVLIEDVTEIKESPNRLRPDLANKIYEVGESGMGYCLYKLVLDNGQTVDVCTGNAVDFVPLPNGLTTKDIKDVLPHQASRENFVKGPEYYWCLFKGDIPKTYKDNKYEKSTSTNSSLPKARRTWWQKLFGSE